MATKRATRPLRWASAIWRENTRRIDIACRYGGEEFAVVLPGTRLSQAVLTAERLRNSLANAPVDLNGEPVILTASFGVDVCLAQEDLSAEAFLNRADHFLLQAKATGRNRCCHRKLEMTEVSTEVTSEERAALRRGWIEKES